MSKFFKDPNLTEETYWRSIILLGHNTASYKFALGKTLLEENFSSTNVKIEDLALPFVKNICDHLKINKKQIKRKNQGDFLNSCEKFNNSQIAEDELKSITIKKGFENVIDAFHNVRSSEVPRFFEDNRKKKKEIILTDSFYKLKELDKFNNLHQEVESRWRLWGSAISEGINPIIMDPNTENLLSIVDNERRINVTSFRSAANGYQKGKCFYCPNKISIESKTEGLCHVDHFFPFVLKKRFNFKNIDQIWNLVLSCQDCNNGSGGKFDRIPHLDFLDDLKIRNDSFLESTHPLRETIISQTGLTNEDRISFLQRFYNDAYEKIPSKWKPKSANIENE